MRRMGKCLKKTKTKNEMGKKCLKTISKIKIKHSGAILELHYTVYANRIHIIVLLLIEIDYYITSSAKHRRTITIRRGF